MQRFDKLLQKPLRCNSTTKKVYKIGITPKSLNLEFPMCLTLILINYE